MTVVANLHDLHLPVKPKDAPPQPSFVLAAHAVVLITASVRELRRRRLHSRNRQQQQR